nr:MarR family transcriptional regulator [Eubacterium sp. 1001713B170207_170306_E7]
MNKMTWLNKSKMEKALKGYKPSEVHFIEYIGRNADSNVTRLAESFYMTRGAISKISRKLMEKGVIESYQKPDNKKEIYFRLTARGREVYAVHEALHNAFQKRDKPVFDTITDGQLNDMLCFMETYTRHLDAEIEKLNTRLKPK